MNCHDARAELAALLPREPRGPALRAHLAQCPACRAEAERLATVDATLAAHFSRLEPRPEFDARLRAALARAAAERSTAREATDAEDLEPTRRSLRAASVLDGLAAAGVGATLLGLALQAHGPIAQWLEAAASGRLGAVSTSGTLVVGTLTLAAVAATVGGAAAWLNSRRA